MRTELSTGLAELDFDFVGSSTGFLTHSIHPYPAKFIPQIPQAIIRELSRKGDVVADVFCGSGTTLVEALRLGRNAVGVDANPLACVISEVKTTRMAPGGEELLLDLALRAESFGRKLNVPGAASNTVLWPEPPFISNAPRPSSEAIQFWFEPHVVEELAEILQWCKELPDPSLSKVALVAFSSIVVTVSKQDSDTRYVRREKGTVPGGTFIRFAKSVRASVKSLADLAKEIPDDVHCRVLRSSVLDRPALPLCSLMVCSPPYPNAYSYHLYHMTRMVWLGMDQVQFKREEIGSHRKYSSKGATAATVETFRTEMGTVLKWLRDTLTDGGHACFVIGNSIIKGEHINNADVIADVATGAGYEEIARLSRRLDSKKKAFNPAIGKIKEECVLILQKRDLRWT